MADGHRRSWIDTLANFARLGFWLLLIYLLLVQFLAPNAVQQQRAKAFAQFQEARKSRVIALIHRYEKVSFFGVPVASSINIEDSEALLRAIRATPDDQPIDVILHTPGGLVLAAEQIARALVDHKAKVTVFVPHYAMSGGTLISLAADEIVMDPNAVLGPVDPQVGGAPAASIIKAVESKPIERVSDQTLVIADIARKAQVQVQTLVREILEDNGQLSKETAAATAKVLTEGRWTHDYPITVKTARSLGLRVTTEMPAEVYNLMALYPQAGSKRPSVLYMEPAGTPRQGAPAQSNGAVQGNE
ncbi:MAG TPA: ATP-dependent Clp protease proteolytic subunit [Burkholderiales bacterium]|nr:ATP-dependent Clp protease proteolytic subunit [Burkholderiales bacterium]